MLSSFRYILMRIISIGEVLWDIVGDAEHLGGAPFNFAFHAHMLGHEVTFISAVGKDARGDRILEKMREMGLNANYVSRTDGYSTGTATVSTNAAGDLQFVIHRPAAYDFVQLSGSDLQAVTPSSPDWIYFGTLAQQSPKTHATTQRLLETTRARRFYDVNLRPQCYDPSLVRELASLAEAVKLSHEERFKMEQMFGTSYNSPDEFCRSYRDRFGWKSIAITRGDQGCCLLLNDHYCEAPAYRISVRDAIGAGDAFSAALLHGIGAGWECERVADFANRAAAIVVSRPGATPKWQISEATSLTDRRDV